MILVTGGTGLLGSHLLVELTKNEEPIRVLYRSENRINRVREVFKYYDPENWEKRFSGIEWVQGDILDITELENAFDNCDKVYHCAALVSFHSRDFNQLLKINREGTENVVNFCLDKNIKKLCYVSSTAAIGDSVAQIVSEETKWKKSPTTSGYSISKYCAEREVWRGIEEGLNAVIVNPCVIFGAGSWSESSLEVFNTVKKGLRHYPPGANSTVDARDVAEIMIRLMESEIHSERYLCIGSNQSFKELMATIAAQLKVKAPVKPASRGLVNFTRRLLWIIYGIRGKRNPITRDTVNNLFAVRSYDNSKIREALQFEFRPLDEQVRNTIAGRIN